MVFLFQQEMEKLEIGITGQRILSRDYVFQIVSKLEANTYDKFTSFFRNLAETIGIAKTYGEFQISELAAKEAVSFFERETGKKLNLNVSNSHIENNQTLYMDLLSFQYTKTFRKILETIHSENATANMLEYMSFFETCHVNGYYKGFLSPLSYWLFSSAISNGFLKKTDKQGVFEYRKGYEKKSVVFSLMFGEKQLELAKDFVESLNDKEIKKIIKGSGFNSKQDILENLNNSIFSDRSEKLDTYFEKHGNIFEFFYFMHNSLTGNLITFYTDAGNSTKDILYKSKETKQVTVNDLTNRFADTIAMKSQDEMKRMADLHQYLFWLKSLYGFELSSILIMDDNLNRLENRFKTEILRGLKEQ